MKNVFSSEWKKKLKKAFREVGDGKGLGWIKEGTEIAEKKKREEERKTKEDQELQIR